MKKDQIKKIIKEEISFVIAEQKMTRQHFQLIANTLASNKNQSWEDIVIAFKDALKETNPRFNENAFMKAAGLDF